MSKVKVNELGEDCNDFRIQREELLKGIMKCIKFLLKETNYLEFEN